MRVVVGITGGSGAGKTTFAKRLLDKLGQDAVLLSQDDYYKHLPHMTKEEAAVYDFDAPDAIETGLLVDHVRMLKNGISVDVPSYDFATHTRIEAARCIGPAQVVLVEGLFVMHDLELRKLIDLAVFIDVDADVCVLRRILRDCRERGASLERAVSMYLDTCKPAYERYVEPCKSSADILVEDSLSDAELEAVIERINGLLGQ